MGELVATIEALFRYPVKSMSGEALDEAELGWHGLTGDRRLGLRRLEDRRGFPWLTASKLPELLRYVPLRRDASPFGDLPTHVRTPGGAELGLFSDALADEIAARCGAQVEMTHLDRGIFDEASVSAITQATIDGIAERAGHPSDVRRFRPNLLLSTRHDEPFAEDAWVGGVLTFGDEEAAAAVAVTNWDVRCSMINYDPDSARSHPEMLKAVVRDRDNKAGVYATVIRRGRLAVGQPVYFQTDPG